MCAEQGLSYFFNTKSISTEVWSRKFFQIFFRKSLQCGLILVVVVVVVIVIVSDVGRNNLTQQLIRFFQIDQAWLVLWLFFKKNGPIPATFWFIFVLFSLQFQYKLEKA